MDQCNFCEVVLMLYPKLEGMSARDSKVFVRHLVKVHGLIASEIPV